MKIALTVLKWVGFGLSILAIFGSFTYVPLIAACGIGLVLIAFSCIVNGIAIKKHFKEQRSIKMGVLQIITLVGLVPGVIMIVATCLNKKQLEKEYEEAEKFFEAAIDEVEAEVDTAVEEAEAAVEEF